MLKERQNKYIYKTQIYPQKRANRAHQDISTNTPWTIIQSTKKKKAQNNSLKKRRKKQETKKRKWKALTLLTVPRTTTTKRGGGKGSGELQVKSAPDFDARAVCLPVHMSFSQRSVPTFRWSCTCGTDVLCPSDGIRTGFCVPPSDLCFEQSSKI